mmetsp:Transcript_22419/g.50882  ORF Transcript_22419/g.50882 Transcript_22419/m.50882 type:complete len:242 (+) Transcript_22419:153-878(+)
MPVNIAKRFASATLTVVQENIAGVHTPTFVVRLHKGFTQTQPSPMSGSGAVSLKFMREHSAVRHVLGTIRVKFLVKRAIQSTPTGVVVSTRKSEVPIAALWQPQLVRQPQRSQPHLRRLQSKKPLLLQHRRQRRTQRRRPRRLYQRPQRVAQPHWQVTNLLYPRTRGADPARPAHAVCAERFALPFRTVHGENGAGRSIRTTVGVSRRRTLSELHHLGHHQGVVQVSSTRVACARISASQV